MDATTSTPERRTDRFSLDEDVELLGMYQSSGLQVAPYLLRRGDGQVVQVSRLIYLIAGRIDPREHPDPADRNLDAVATEVSDLFGQDVSPPNVEYLIENRLRPAGLLARALPNGNGTGTGESNGNGDPDANQAVAVEPEPMTRANPLLALRLRLPLVPTRIHKGLTNLFKPMFWPPLVVAVLAVFVAMDVWLIGSQGHALISGGRQVVYQPQLLLGIAVLTIISATFHEIGHAAAARYGGATPGSMGVGVYIVWPVFYTDVTDSYRLDRRGRLRVDLGGVYFNVIFALVIAALYQVTGFEPLLVFLVISQMETARQFLPFVRLDGYYVVSDLAGVPNLFTYMGPVLINLIRRGNEDTRRAARARLDELTPKARYLITGWVLLTAPVLFVNLVAFLLIAPRLAGAAWGSATGQIQELTTGGQADPIGIINAIIGVTLLVLPIAGMTYIVGRIALRGIARARSWWESRPLTTATVSMALATVVVLQVAMQWPETFGAALRNAQVAQHIEEARDEGRVEELAALLPQASVDPPVASSLPEPPMQELLPPSEQPGSSGSNSPGPSAGGPSSATDADRSNPSATAVPSQQVGDAPPEPPEVADQGVSDTSTSTSPSSTSTTTSTTTTTEPPKAEPEPQRSSLEELLHLFF